MRKLSQDSEDAKKFIKKNKNLLFKKFASDKIFKPNEKPISLFMAGSPGAGKTEYSKRFIEEFDSDIARIDADDIRKIIPQYNGANSFVVQGAASIGVDILYSYVLKNRIKVYLVIKDYSNNIRESYLDVNIDSYLKIKYSRERLNKILKDTKYEK